MSKTIKELATMLSLSFQGEANYLIKSLAPLKDAKENELAFAVEPHVEAAKDSKAGALILQIGTKGFSKDRPIIYSADPKATFAEILTIYHPPTRHEVGVSDKAYIGKDVIIEEGVTVLPLAYIEDYAHIKKGAIIYPHAYIGQHSIIGENTVIYPLATVRENCVIGRNVVIHSSAVIGADGFGFTTHGGVHTKVPQVGGVIIEDEVEIGAHVGIDRATLGMTVIGKGTKIDNLVHIGHNCKIGENCLIVAQTGISGSTTVGNNVTFGGQVGTVGHINIGGNSVYAARSGIISDMPEGVFCSGFPVQPHKDWLKMQSAMRKLPSLQKKIKELEKELDKINKTNRKKD